VLKIEAIALLISKEEKEITCDGEVYILRGTRIVNKRTNKTLSSENIATENGWEAVKELQWFEEWNKGEVLCEAGLVFPGSEKPVTIECSIVFKGGEAVLKGTDIVVKPKKLLTYTEVRAKLYDKETHYSID